MGLIALMGSVALSESAGSTSWIQSALSTVSTLFTWVLDLITANPILAVLFACGTLVPAGLSIFSRVKKASR